jgi:hypothetical protein
MANQGPHYAKGKYVCEILNQALSKAGTGTPQFVIQFKVLGTPSVEEPGSYDPDPFQYERTMYRSITEKTIDYLIEDLRNLGVSIQSLKQLDPSSAGFFDLRGKVVDLWCNHEPGQSGGMREKWGVARAVSEFKVEPLEAAKMRELDNLFGKQLKAAFKPNGGQQSRPQPAAVAATEISDDDVPF